MGLDMYAFATRKAPSDKVDFPQHKEDFELHNWRKRRTPWLRKILFYIFLALIPIVIFGLMLFFVKK